jgi:hypothetical protein
MKDILKLKWLVEYKHFDKNWNLISVDTDTNLIVNAGIAQVIQLAWWLGWTAFTYLATGSGTTAPAAGQTALVTENTASGSGRKSATTTAQTTTITWDTLQLVATWNFTGNITVWEVWVFNAASWGAMLARQVPSLKYFDDWETLEITYKIVLS